MVLTALGLASSERLWIACSSPSVFHCIVPLAVAPSEVALGIKNDMSTY